MGPVENRDPRFGDVRGLAPVQDVLDPTVEVLTGHPEWPGGSVYPAVEEARERYQVTPPGDERARLLEEYHDTRGQAWDYADPLAAGQRERARILEGALAGEADRQSRLTGTFGSPEERARRMMELEASRQLAPPPSVGQREGARSSRALYGGGEDEEQLQRYRAILARIASERGRYAR